MISELAIELNEKIDGTALYHQLSDFGKRIYFPKGTKKQSEEAKKYAYKYNATEGMAFAEDHPFVLKNIRNYLQELNIEDVVTYAPILGLPSLRELWKKELYRKNNSLENKNISKPIVTGGLTHGLSIAGDLFTDENTVLVIPDLFWPNYEIIYKERRNCLIKTYNFFEKGKIDFESFKKTIREIEKNKKIFTIFNFPHNPTGYSLTHREVSEIKEIMKAFADDGYKITVLLDDAYFGLVYEDNISSESLFSIFADLHKNIIAIKVDGASKEYYGWGLRVGFITFSSKGFGNEHYAALENKLSGLIRSSISNSSKISQLILEKMIMDKETEKEKKKYFADLKNRYKAVKKIISVYSESILSPFPFNSGYFMCFTVKTGKAEILRKYLLEHYGIGTTSMQNKYLRVAFACVDEKNIKNLYEIIYKASMEYLDENIAIKNTEVQK